MSQSVSALLRSPGAESFLGAESQPSLPYNAPFQYTASRDEDLAATSLSQLSHDSGLSLPRQLPQAQSKRRPRTNLPPPTPTPHFPSTPFSPGAVFARRNASATAVPLLSPQSGAAHLEDDTPSLSQQRLPGHAAAAAAAAPARLISNVFRGSALASEQAAAARAASAQANFPTPVFAGAVPDTGELAGVQLTIPNAFTVDSALAILGTLLQKRDQGTNSMRNEFEQRTEKGKSTGKDWNRLSALFIPPADGADLSNPVHALFRRYPLFEKDFDFLEVAPVDYLQHLRDVLLNPSAVVRFMPGSDDWTFLHSTLDGFVDAATSTEMVKVGVQVLVKVMWEELRAATAGGFIASLADIRPRGPQEINRWLRMFQACIRIPYKHYSYKKQASRPRADDADMDESKDDNDVGAGEGILDGSYRFPSVDPETWWPRVAHRQPLHAPRFYPTPHGPIENWLLNAGFGSENAMYDADFKAGLDKGKDMGTYDAQLLKDAMGKLSLVLDNDKETDVNVERPWYTEWIHANHSPRYYESTTAALMAGAKTWLDNFVKRTLSIGEAESSPAGLNWNPPDVALESVRRFMDVTYPKLNKGQPYRDASVYKEQLDDRESFKKKGAEATARAAAVPKPRQRKSKATKAVQETNDDNAPYSRQHNGGAAAAPPPKRRRGAAAAAAEDNAEHAERFANVERENARLQALVRDLERRNELLEQQSQRANNSRVNSAAAGAASSGAAAAAAGLSPIQYYLS